MRRSPTRLASPEETRPEWRSTAWQFHNVVDKLRVALIDRINNTGRTTFGQTGRPWSISDSITGPGKGNANVGARGGWLYRYFQRHPVVGALCIPAALVVIMHSNARCSMWIADMQDEPVSPWHDSMPSQVYHADRVSFSQLVRVVPYDVLGKQRRSGGEEVRLAKAPEQRLIPEGEMPLETVMVDPTQLTAIQKGINAAKGLSAEVMDWVADEGGIPVDGRYPPPVRNAIQSVGHAKRWVYNGLGVVHTAEPDFRSGVDIFRVRRDLVSQYKNVLYQFACHCEPECEYWQPMQTHMNSRQPYFTLRTPPLGATFAGRFKDAMPDLTIFALLAAFEELPGTHRRAIMKRAEFVDICVREEQDLQRYIEAYERRAQLLHVWKLENRGEWIDPCDGTATLLPPVQLKQPNYVWDGGLPGSPLERGGVAHV